MNTKITIHSEKPLLISLCGGYDSNFTYLLGCPQTGELALIDTSVEWDLINEGVQKAINEFGYKKLSKVFLTHTHFDHIVSVKDVVGNTEDLEIYVHESSVEKVNSATNHEEKVIAIQGKQTLSLGEEKLETIYTPGHQPDCICFVWNAKIFTGDTLFVEGAGRVDLVGGNPQDQIETLKHIATKLPDEWEVYAGHDYGSIPVSTIGREKQVNRFLQFSKK